MVRPTVHTDPSRLRSFSRAYTFPAGGFWNLRLLRVSVRTENHFANKTFWTWWRHDNHVISLNELSSNANVKCTGDCRVLKLLWRSVDEKHFLLFQSENAVFKFLWRGVYWAWVSSELIWKQRTSTKSVFFKVSFCTFLLKTKPI